VAGEAQATLLFLSPSNLLSKFVGEAGLINSISIKPLPTNTTFVKKSVVTEQTLNKIFAVAKKKAPAVCSFGILLCCV